jgi:hypothetical protein
MKHFSMLKSALLWAIFCLSFLTRIQAQSPPTNATCANGCVCSTSYSTPCAPNQPLPCLVMACSATGNYNCHQYTRSLNESGSPCSNSPSGINSDNRYIRVCDKTAPMVYYTSDHSAVRQGENYVSKWNCHGDLMRHTLEGYPGSHEFYVYVGAIADNCNNPLNNSCTLTQARVFSLVNIAGLSYSWAISNGSIVSISGSGSSVTLTPLCPGTVTLTVSITGCGQFTKTQTMTIVSTPSSPGPSCCFTGYYSTPNGSNLMLNTANSVPVGYVSATINNYPGATYFCWRKVSGNNIPYYVSDNGKNLSCSIGSGQSISFDVQAKSGDGASCQTGTVLCTRSITFYQSSWGMAVQSSDGAVTDENEVVSERGKVDLQASVRPYPNPSDGAINIASTYGSGFTVQMFDLVGGLLLENTFPAGTELVTLQAPEEIRNSLIILKISDGKQSATYKQWIIRN